METSEFDYQGGFFDQFPAESRSYLMNLFCFSCREFVGSPTIEELLAAVARRVEKGIFYGNRVELLEKVAAALSTEEAKGLAAFVIQRESLPFELRAKIKSERALQYRSQWMAAQPPTPQQLNYLKKLGCQVKPASMEEASERIDAALKFNAEFEDFLEYSEATVSKILRLVGEMRELPDQSEEQWQVVAASLKRTVDALGTISVQDALVLPQRVH